MRETRMDHNYTTSTLTKHPQLATALQNFNAHRDESNKLLINVDTSNNFALLPSNISTPSIQIILKESEKMPDGQSLKTLAQAASTQSPIQGQQIIVNGQIFPPPNAQPLPICSESTAMRAMQIQSQENQCRVTCSECKQTFDTGDLFFNHWLELHCKLEPTAPLKKKKAFQKDKDSFVVMQKCDKEQGHKKLSKVGLVEIGGTKRKAAQTGDKNSQRNVKIAKKVAPTNPVCCGVCSVDLKTVTSFFLHWLNTHHSIMDVLEEVWQCGHCLPNRLYPSQENVRSHIRSQHPLEGSVFECSVGENPACGVKFYSAEDFEDHKKNFHEKGFCKECSRVVVNVAKHFSFEHQGVCDVCDCIVAKTRLSDHISKVHRLELVWDRKKSKVSTGGPQTDDSLSVVATEADKAKKPASDSGQVSCKACGLTFRSDKLLEKHYLANHEFQCKFCDRKMDKDVYGDHLRLHLAKQRKKN